MIRLATGADVPVVLQLVKELAHYEKEPDAVVASEDDLHAALFGPDAVASCHLADLQDAGVHFDRRSHGILPAGRGIAAIERHPGPDQIAMGLR